MSAEPRPELRALADRLFAAARAERPSAALGRRLLLIAPASGAAASGASRGSEARAPARADRHAARWLGVAALAAASVGLWWSFGERPVIDMSPDPVVSRPRVSAERRAPLASEAAGRPLNEAREPREMSEPRVEGEASAARQVPADQALPMRAPGAASAASSSESAHSAREPSAKRRALPRVLPLPEPAASTASDVTIAAARASLASPASGETHDEPSEGAAAPASVPSAQAFSDELAHLKQVRLALRAGDAARALELLDAHANAAESLHAEATLLRVEALAARGRRAEASALADRFVRDNPHSALGDRAKSFIIVTPTRP